MLLFITIYYYFITNRPKTKHLKPFSPIIKSEEEGEDTLVSITLVNGVQMPILGFGTWMLQGRECYDAVYNAIKAGIKTNYYFFLILLF